MNKHLKLTLLTILLIIFLTTLSFKIVLKATSTTQNQQETIDFLNSKANILDPLYETNEISHLQDVKKVFQKTTILFYLSLLIITLLITLNKTKSKRTTLLKNLNKASKYTLISLTTITLLTIISFNTIFKYFHLIFFPQGNWQFPNNSFIIQTFPLNFFITISFKIFILTIIITTLIYFYTKKKIKWFSKPKELKPGFTSYYQ